MQSEDRVVVVLGTGGTIAGLASRPDENLRYTSAQVGVDDLVSGVATPAGVALETEQVAQLDSKDMDIATWLLLARRIAHHLARPEVAGVVVTHGTDTMEETAYFLSRVLATGKPVVLTGAMRPASSSDADGPRNLADAITVAAHPAATGVVVVFAGDVHAARAVRKAHPQRPDAFTSGERGPLGSVLHGTVTLVREGDGDGAEPSSGIDLSALPDEHAWPWVEIITSAAGVDGRVVGLLADAGVDGIVVAASGNGTVHRALAAALEAASRRGTAVMRSSRCLDGAILGDEAGSLPSAGDLTPVKARIAMMLDLLVDPDAVRPG